MKTIEELAREAGLEWLVDPADEYGRPVEAARFAALVAAECAREAQAMVVRDHDAAAEGYSMDHWNQCCESVAIRLIAAFPMPKE